MTRVVTFAGLVVSLLIAVAVPCTASEPTADELARIERSLAEAGQARVIYHGRRITLIAPRADSAGLAFDRELDEPHERPAVFVSRGWDSIPPAPNPIPWAAIERLEVSHRSRTPTAIAGGAIAFLAPILVAPGITAGAAYVAAESGGGETVLVGAVVGITLAGAVIGSRFTTTEWRRIDLPKESQ